MAIKKRQGNPRDLSEVAINILQNVREDFVAKGLGAKELNEHYVGVSLNLLQQKYCEIAGVTQVDFDLAFKELEDALFVNTGPMVPFDNKPGSGIFIMSLFSKREYAYLTEAGYRAAQTAGQSPRNTLRPYVHISGGTFNQTQIGIGGQITQTQTINVDDDAEVIARLTELFSTTGEAVDRTSKADIERLLEVTRQGDSAAAKPLFHKLFGFASETVKQTAWSILAAIITKAMGM